MHRRVPVTHKQRVLILSAKMAEQVHQRKPRAKGLRLQAGIGSCSAQVHGTRECQGPGQSTSRQRLPPC